MLSSMEQFHGRFFKRLIKAQNAKSSSLIIQKPPLDISFVIRACSHKALTMAEKQVKIKI